MQDFRGFHNVVLENTRRVGIRHHQRCDIFSGGLRQYFQIDHAPVVRTDVLDCVSGHRDRCRIGPMRRIGNQNFLTRIALRFKQSADQQDASEFTVRASGRLQRNRIHARNFSQRSFQRRHDLHCALRERLRLIRMDPSEPVHARHGLIHARIIFHGAGPERIQAVIDRVILRREAREVADRFHLTNLWKIFDLAPDVRSAQNRRWRNLRHIEFWELISKLAG